MPELPEVETIKRDLEKEVVGRRITAVEGDWPKTVSEPEFAIFQKEVTGRKIKALKRRAKNLIISLDKEYLLVHFKMTGHMLVADAGELHKDHWAVKEASSPLADRVNQFIHLAFYLDNGKVMALSDLRKFARVSLVSKERLDTLLAHLGPEPLEDDFDLELFKKQLSGKKGYIKQILLQQEVVAGIGNIYADEILFDAKILPLRKVTDLSNIELKKIYKSIVKILSKAVDLRGTSTSDFRDAAGEKGKYTDIRKVYRRTGEPCLAGCGGVVQRVKISGRSAHYCPNCQK